MKIHKEFPKDNEFLFLVGFLVIAGFLGQTYFLSVIELYFIYIIFLAFKTGRITFLGKWGSPFLSGTRTEDPFIYWMTVCLWIFIALFIGWLLVASLNGTDIMRHSYLGVDF